MFDSKSVGNCICSSKSLLSIGITSYTGSQVVFFIIGGSILFYFISVFGTTRLDFDGVNVSGVVYFFIILHLCADLPYCTQPSSVSVSFDDNSAYSKGSLLTIVGHLKTENILTSVVLMLLTNEEALSSIEMRSGAFLPLSCTVNALIDGLIHTSSSSFTSVSCNSSTFLI